MEKELSIAIVKGQVGDFAKGVARNNNVPNETLAIILRELADLLG